jgi:protein associated with RNAse G/E
MEFFAPSLLRLGQIEASTINLINYVLEIKIYSKKNYSLICLAEISHIIIKTQYIPK